MMKMPEDIEFTTISEKLEYYEKLCYAPVFRRTFSVKSVRKAELSVCGLGYGYYYINGNPVTNDLFTAPVSNYGKTLWYNTYDVTELLTEGNNVITVICGNGWFNENLNSSGSFNRASWRSTPMFALSLECDGAAVLKSGEKGFKWSKSAITYNQLRSGEHFDHRLYNENIFKKDYDDKKWENAVTAERPRGIFRKCLCEPIREDRVFEPVSTVKTGENRYLYDFGQNMSGYVRLETKGASGDELIIRYSEDITSENELQYNGALVHYPETEYETDRVICSGEKFTWSPRFTYHGFRYIEISGLKDFENTEVKAVFVHQDIEKRSGFKCSDEFLNSLFYMGEMSTLSNLFYMPTDCPSREKLGWLNDVQFSCDWFLTGFKTEKLLIKWLTDIYDAVNGDGSVTAIVPSWGWGMSYSGAVCDGALYEIPYRIYLHTGNEKPLIKSLPYFKRNLVYLKSFEDTDGLSEKGLGDHAAPNFSKATPKKLINGVITAKLYEITALAAELAGENGAEFMAEKERIAQAVRKKYYREDRQCAAEDQTSVAMLIVSGFCEDTSQLKMQLSRLVGENMYHHSCGAVGLWYLYRALDMLGLSDYVYKIIKAKGFPSYSMWLESGATTLHELWKGNPEKKKEFLIGSENHHMYSDVCGWFIHTVLGIKPDINYPGFESVDITPRFIKELSYAEGYCDTVKGRIKVSWKREGESITLCISVPGNLKAYYNGKKLKQGENAFLIKGEKLCYRKENAEFTRA